MAFFDDTKEGKRKMKNEHLDRLRKLADEAPSQAEILWLRGALDALSGLKSNPEEDDPNYQRGWADAHRWWDES